MKKFFLLLALLLCFVGQGFAGKIQLSATLPSEGTPEHLYTMMNGYGMYADANTAIASSADNIAKFAFYASDISGAYYIYCYTAGKWISYTKSSSYSSQYNFLTLSDTKSSESYFKFNNYSEDYYQISPYTTSGIAASYYLNWYFESGTSLGLWSSGGADDGGSCWAFSEQSDVRAIGGIYYMLSGNTAVVTSNPNGYSGSISIPASVTYASGSYAVTEIGIGAFKNCSNLTSVTLPNSISSVNGYAFYGCSGLSSLTIPDAVTDVGGYAFYGCSGMRSIIFGTGLQIFGEHAISNCSSLTDITFKANNPPTRAVLFSISGSNNISTIHVPAGRASAYNISPWRNYTIVEEEEGGEGEENSGFLSTTLPSEGTPEHLFTMLNGYGYYANGTTSPTRTPANRALFAFYQSEVEGAYYIYCYTSNKWLTYTKASSYDNSRGFIVLSDTKIEGTYFKCNNYSDNYYEISPYTTSGSTSKYLNWYNGVGSDSYKNPLDGTITLGLWQQNGATDAGSRWRFEELTPYFITVDGIKYEVNDVTHTAKVDENTGIEGSIVIPETVEHNGSSYAVTGIGDNAFSNCTGMIGIKMLASTPPTASSSAFSGCTNLTTIYVPKGATAAYNVAPWNSYEIVEFADTWTILDNGAAAYTEKPNFMANSLNYTRNFTHTSWQALYVPFDIPYDAISDKFDVAELIMFHQYDDDNDGAFDRTELEVLRLRAGSTIEHHTPYVIRAKETGEQTIAVSDVTAYRAEEKEFECMSLKRRYVFHGTYSGVSGADMLAGGYYALANGELRKAASASAALGGFRWYVSVTDRATGLPVSPAALPAKMRIVEQEDGEATGIAAAPAAAPLPKDTPVYDLNGRRVGTADAIGALPKGVYIVNGKKVIR